MKLYASGEDYLEIILVLQKKLGMVRSVDVAREVAEQEQDENRIIQAILPRKTGKEKKRCRAGSFVRPKWIFRVLRRF